VVERFSPLFIETRSSALATAGLAWRVSLLYSLKPFGFSGFKAFLRMFSKHRLEYGESGRSLISMFSTV